MQAYDGKAHLGAEISHSPGLDPHYNKLSIQPLDYCMKNGLSSAQAKVIKYVTRFQDKGGLEDLKKARDMVNYLAKFHYDADINCQPEK